MAVFNSFYALKQRFSNTADRNFSNDALLNPFHAIVCKREVLFFFFAKIFFTSAIEQNCHILSETVPFPSRNPFHALNR